MNTMTPEQTPAPQVGWERVAQIRFVLDKLEDAKRINQPIVPDAAEVLAGWLRVAIAAPNPTEAEPNRDAVDPLAALLMSQKYIDKRPKNWGEARAMAAGFLKYLPPVWTTPQAHAPSPVAPAPTPLWENLEGCQCMRCGQSHHHFHDTGWKISTPPEAPKATEGEPTRAQVLALYKGKQAAVEVLSKQNEALRERVKELEEGITRAHFTLEKLIPDLSEGRE